MILKGYKRFFGALANKKRLLILQTLYENECSVNELAEKTGIEQSLVSHNLKCLSNCYFIKSRKEGKKTYYSANKKLLTPILKQVNKHLLEYCDELFSCGVLSEEEAGLLKEKGRN